MFPVQYKLTNSTQELNDGKNFITHPSFSHDALFTHISI